MIGSLAASAVLALAGCDVLPADNIWNVPVDTLPVHSRSQLYIESVGTEVGVHPDFGSGTYRGAPIGIPFVIVDSSQPKVAVTFEYDGESDPGPYPIPTDVPIEGGRESSGDRHVIVVDATDCFLYELFAAFPNSDGTWRAGSGAAFDLGSNALRPAGWTSADAAGLPILPGLVRRSEVASGVIEHAIRFTAPRTRREFVWPARHFASQLTDEGIPPMGQRFRLRGDFDVAEFSSDTQVILTALKRYGVILADNGSPWYLTGEPHADWDNDSLVNELRQVRGRDFEAVDVSSLIVDPDSGQVKSAAATATPTRTPMHLPTATATSTADAVASTTPTPTGSSVATSSASATGSASATTDVTPMPASIFLPMLP